jgi:hypothetical protein
MDSLNLKVKLKMCHSKIVVYKILSLLISVIEYNNYFVYFQEMIVEYFGTPGWQATGIFVGGFAVAGAIVAYNVWGH